MLVWDPTVMISSGQTVAICNGFKDSATIYLRDSRKNSQRNGTRSLFKRTKAYLRLQKCNVFELLTGGSFAIPRLSEQLESFGQTLETGSLNGHPWSVISSEVWSIHYDSMHNPGICELDYGPVMPWDTFPTGFPTVHPFSVVVENTLLPYGIWILMNLRFQISEQWLTHSMLVGTYLQQILSGGKPIVRRKKYSCPIFRRA